VRAAELRKHGIKVRLHDQPFRILLRLLSRPGEVVLREEIRKLLWPDDTVVEFDRSINAAIQRLRDALGDSAEHPRYVETLARRGYRFIGAVEPAETGRWTIRRNGAGCWRRTTRQSIRRRGTAFRKCCCGYGSRRSWRSDPGLG
jgi:DNA-binding winged helix-turn-helix (wHTH) protein